MTPQLRRAAALGLLSLFLALLSRSTSAAGSFVVLLFVVVFIIYFSLFPPSYFLSSSI